MATRVETRRELRFLFIGITGLPAAGSAEGVCKRAGQALNTRPIKKKNPDENVFEARDPNFTTNRMRLALKVKKNKT